MQIDRLVLQAEPEQSTARDVQLAKLAARQHGVVTFADLIACGFTHDAISVRVGNGRLHPLHRVSTRSVTRTSTLDGCYLAAVKACGEEAVLSHRSAGDAQNIIRWEDRYPDVLVLGDSVPRHPRINGHCTSYLPPHHVTTVRGIPVTTAERTLLDLAAVLPEHRLRRAVRQAQFLKLTTVRLAGGGAARPRADARAQEARADPCQERRSDAERARGRRARSHPARRVRSSACQCAVVHREAAGSSRTSAGPSNGS